MLKQTMPPPLPLPVNHPDQWVQELENFVTSNLGNTQLSVDLVARHFQISSRQLQRRLQNQLHCSPSVYLREKRLLAAHTYLVEGRFSTAKQAAQAVGFQDYRYFSQQFQLRFKQKPSELKGGTVKASDTDEMSDLPP